MALHWSAAARRDLLEVWLWRGREFPMRGDKALERIESACLKLRKFPYIGAPAPRLASDARKLLIDGYLAIYRVDEDVVLIMRVLDQRRLMDAGAFSED